jgi:uncharacterized protein (PEP-CTERM system associated)
MAINTVKAPRLLPLALALMALAPAARADWRFVPTLNETQTFSDNIALQRDAHAGWVADTAPGFTLTGASPRVQVSAFAREHVFFFLGQRQPGTQSTQLEYDARGNARLVNDWLYLDASASQNLQAISAFGQNVEGNLWATGNRAEVSNWRLSPYLRHRFAGRADLTVRYTLDHVEANHNLLGSSDGQGVFASLASGPAFDTLGWNLDYTRQQLDNDVAGRSTSETALGKLRLRATRTIALTASTGYDRYDFSRLGGHQQGRNWAGGFIWTPSARTTVDASWGRRFNSPSGSLAASHRARHSMWSINYSDAVITARDQFLIPSTLDTADMLDKLFAAAFPDPFARNHAVQNYMQVAGLPATLPHSINYFSNRFLRQKNLQLGAVLTGAHGSLTLGLYDTRRQALPGQPDDPDTLGGQLNNINSNVHQRGFGSTYSYRLSSRSTALMSATLGRTRSLSTGLEQSTAVVRLGVTHRLSERMQGAVELRRSHGGAGLISNGTYTENAVSATLSIQL